MSRVLTYIFAVMLAVLSVGVSVMQFHHHGHGGRICMCADVERHASTDDCDDHNRPSHCEMRLNHPMLADTGTRQTDVPPVSLTAVISDADQSCLATAAQLVTEIYVSDDTSRYAPPGLPGMLRRGPPACISFS